MHKFIHFRVPIKGAYFLVLLSFLVALSISFLAPVFPLYIKSLVQKEAYVGYVTATIAVLLLISNFIVSRFLDSFNKRTLLKIGLLGSAITVILLSVINTLHYFLILEIFRAFFLVAVYFTIALFIRDYAASSNLGKLEGMHFTISNCAWLIGPLLGATIAEKASMSTVFILGSIFPLVALLLIFIHPLKVDGIKQNNHKNTIENIRYYFKDKDLRSLYFISVGLVMWWAMIYTFAPLFVVRSGLSTSFIGYLFFAVSIPLIILEIPIGKLADKYGFRKYFFLGFLIIAIAAGLSYFFSPIVTLFLLAFASFGAAFLEPLRDAYFLEKVKKEEVAHKFAVYRTSIETGQILGPIIFSTILLYSGFKYLFLSVSVLMLIFAFMSLRIREIKK